MLAAMGQPRGSRWRTAVAVFRAALVLQLAAAQTTTPGPSAAWSDQAVESHTGTITPIALGSTPTQTPTGADAATSSATATNAPSAEVVATPGAGQPISDAVAVVPTVTPETTAAATTTVRVESSIATTTATPTVTPTAIATTETTTAIPPKSTATAASVAPTPTAEGAAAVQATTTPGSDSTATPQLPSATPEVPTATVTATSTSTPMASPKASLSPTATPEPLVPGAIDTSHPLTATPEVPTATSTTSEPNAPISTSTPQVSGTPTTTPQPPATTATVTLDAPTASPDGPASTPTRTATPEPMFSTSTDIPMETATPTATPVSSVSIPRTTPDPPLLTPTANPDVEPTSTSSEPLVSTPTATPHSMVGTATATPTATATATASITATATSEAPKVTGTPVAIPEAVETVAASPTATANPGARIPTPTATATATATSNPAAPTATATAIADLQIDDAVTSAPEGPTASPGTPTSTPADALEAATPTPTPTATPTAQLPEGSATPTPTVTGSSTAEPMFQTTTPVPESDAIANPTATPNTTFTSAPTTSPAAPTATATAIADLLFDGGMTSTPEGPTASPGTPVSTPADALEAATPTSTPTATPTAQLPEGSATPTPTVTVTSTAEPVVQTTTPVAEADAIANPTATPNATFTSAPTSIPLPVAHTPEPRPACDGSDGCCLPGAALLSEAACASRAAAAGLSCALQSTCVPIGGAAADAGTCRGLPAPLCRGTAGCEVAAQCVDTCASCRACRDAVAYREAADGDWSVAACAEAADAGACALLEGAAAHADLLAASGASYPGICLSLGACEAECLGEPGLELCSATKPPPVAPAPGGCASAGDCAPGTLCDFDNCKTEYGCEPGSGQQELLPCASVCVPVAEMSCTQYSRFKERALLELLSDYGARILCDSEDDATCSSLGMKCVRDERCLSISCRCTSGAGVECPSSGACHGFCAEDPNLPPLVEEARFTTDGRSLEMTLAPWGKPLDVATWSMGGASCAQLFGPVTLGRLGDSPSCSAPFGRKLLVLLGRGATVAPGAAQIRDVNSGTGLLALSPGGLDVGLPLEFPTPLTITISGPSTVSTACGAASWRASASALDPSGRPLLAARWQVLSAPSAATKRDLQGALAAAVAERSGMPAEAALLLRSGDLAAHLPGPLPAGEYRFVLRAQTFLYADAAADYTLNVIDEAAPSVEIAGGSRQPLILDEGARLQLDASLWQSLVACFGSATPSVTWAWGVELAGQELPPLPPPGEGLAYLDLPAFPTGLLRGAEYRLTASVTLPAYGDSAPVTVSSEVLLVPMASNLRVALLGGDGQWPVSQDLVIQAVVVDPESEGAAQVEYEYRWECSHEGVLCLTAGRELLLPPGAPGSAILSLPAGSLVPGGLYTFTLTASIGDRTTSASVVVEPISSEGAPPAARIVRYCADALDCDPTAPVDPLRPLTLQAELLDLEETEVTFRWEVVPSQASGGVLDGPMLTLLPEGLQTGLTALRCTVTNAGTGASATLRVSILGARAPWCSLGDALDACLHISPTEGFELGGDVFLATASGWADDDGGVRADEAVLRYTFGYVNDNGVRVPLASQYLPTFELPNQLPAGPAESGFRRLVFVCVEDLNYARACAERPVAVLPIGAAAAEAALEAVEAGVAMAEASTSRQAGADGSHAKMQSAEQQMSAAVALAQAAAAVKAGAPEASGRRRALQQWADGDGEDSDQGAVRQALELALEAVRGGRDGAAAVAQATQVVRAALSATATDAAVAAAAVELLATGSARLRELSARDALPLGNESLWLLEQVLHGSAQHQVPSGSTSPALGPLFHSHVQATLAAMGAPLRELAAGLVLGSPAGVGTVDVWAVSSLHSPPSLAGRLEASRAERALASGTPFRPSERQPSVSFEPELALRCGERREECGDPVELLTTYVANGSYLAAALDIRLASLAGDGSVEAMEVASGVAGVWMPNMSSSAGGVFDQDNRLTVTLPLLPSTELNDGPQVVTICAHISRYAGRLTYSLSVGDMSSSAPAPMLAALTDDTATCRVPALGEVVVLRVRLSAAAMEEYAQSYPAAAGAPPAVDVRVLGTVLGAVAASVAAFLGVMYCVRCRAAAPPSHPSFDSRLPTWLPHRGAPIEATRSPMDHDTVPRVDGKGGLYGATPGKMQGPSPQHGASPDILAANLVQASSPGPSLDRLAEPA